MEEDTKDMRNNIGNVENFDTTTGLDAGPVGEQFEEDVVVSEEDAKYFSDKIKKVKEEIAKVVIGQERVVDSLIRGLVCNGHVLLEGIPGIAKTLAIMTLGKVAGCSTKRIQFTVDLLPTDIIGITTYTPEKGFEIVKGPIFANFIIADEINRSPPKTQSALLEAMQERNVTIGKETFHLPLPFFVMATQNPLETTGVYLLPEAQIDRFLFKVLMGYPKKEDERVVMKKNITLQRFEDFPINAVMSPEEIIKIQSLVKKVYLNKDVEEYILRIVEATRKKNEKIEYGRYIDWGSSPRATIGIFIASKAQALMQGRNFVIPQDVKDIAHEVLRHRLILNYRAQTENINSEKVIDEILNKVEIP